MANRKELRDARRKAFEATQLATWIENLPRRRGSRIRWANGVVWTRAGDDDWRAEALPEESYPSAHVASYWWEPIPAVVEGQATT